ncbi:alanine:cation symporter family protein, partial [Bacillaceae bacterium HSR45]|nr:alanine:cation symporter family protein [Bacillaceae bacterium HSR45]
MEYLVGLKWVPLYRVVYVIAAYYGAVASLNTVWAFADAANALMM